MKVATVNQHGQIIIPAKIRKEMQITEDTPIKIFTREGEICMQVLQIRDEDLIVPENTVLSFPKDKKIKDFHFKSKNPSQSISEKIDEIIYK